MEMEPHLRCFIFIQTRLRPLRDPSKGHLYPYSSPSGFLPVPLSLGGRRLRWACRVQACCLYSVFRDYGPQNVSPHSTLDDTHDGWAPSPPSPSPIRERKGEVVVGKTASFVGFLGKYLVSYGCSVLICFNMCRIWYLNSAHPARSRSHPACRATSAHLGRSSQVLTSAQV
jgi:hypothetical protein